MNRIILVGNGFDLAFGLKTSYNDFAIDYFKKAYSEIEKNPYNDGLINVVSRPYRTNAKKIEEFKTIKCFIENSDRYEGQRRSNFVLKMDTLIDNLSNKESDYRWVNIENDYYNLLCADLKSGGKNLKHLNKQFGLLQKKLAEYLLPIEQKFLENESQENLKNRLSLANQLCQNSIITKSKPDQLLFLNFNFTKTIEILDHPIRRYLGDRIDYIQLHGELDNPRNEMIFGYGDEEDENYKELEKNDECLKFVKTYRYLHNNNYHKFLNFAHQEDYEVFILGHSCGLSDKTMLTELFNNKNCKAITILPYVKSESLDGIRSTNYLDLAYSIGRIFTDKVAMRRKLINFEMKDVLSISRSKVPEKFNL